MFSVFGLGFKCLLFSVCGLWFSFYGLCFRVYGLGIMFYGFGLGLVFSVKCLFFRFWA